MTTHNSNSLMEKLVSLCKRRGFIFPGSEIYGGLGSSWDYGPLGTELKRNVKNAWWRNIVHQRDDTVGLDSSIIMNPEIWNTSGHAAGFTDPLVECKKCHERYREDQLEPNSKNCLKCNGDLTAPRQFNLMFKTFVGPVEDSAAQAWLRPETAQGIFVNFSNTLTATRRKPPFGIAQIGKAFRNEITPGNFTYRTREFEQMELEFFVPPEDDETWHEYWVRERLEWYLKLGITSDNLRIRDHASDELAHYAKATKDIEFLFPWGWGELEGIANRTDFDLRAHSNATGQSLDYFDEVQKERIIPYVIEPSGGVDRATLAFLIDAYTEETHGDSERVVLKLDYNLAPVKVAILPLSRNEKLTPTARNIHETIRNMGLWKVDYDDSQSIGRRYRRQDEIGTPLCVTIDFDTVEQDQSVTIRERDSMQQTRVSISDLLATLQTMLSQ